jgi:hypothetical protein
MQDRTGKIASECHIEYQADVSYLRACQVFENWNQVEELVIMSIGEPAANRYGMLGMKDVGSRRIVDDDGFSEISPNLGKIFDIVSLVVITTFTEEAVMNHVMDI